MNSNEFQRLYPNLVKNIEEMKSVVKKPREQILNSPNSVKIIERMKYLSYSLTKTLIDIGHSIILNNDFRDPLNRADIFISLAEHSIILSSAVPGVKRAVLALPKISHVGNAEILDIVSESIYDLHKCLDSFAVYFNLKEKGL